MTTAWRIDNVGSGMGNATEGSLNTTNSQYGEWSIAKPRPAPITRSGFKPIGQKDLSNKDGWKPGFNAPAVDPNNNDEFNSQSHKTDNVFQRVKPLDFSKTKFSPRQAAKSVASEGISFTSIQSEPAIGMAGKVDLTKTYGIPHKGPRKPINFTHNIQKIDPHPGFSFETRQTSPKAGRRAIVPPNLDVNNVPDSNAVTLKRTIFSPRGPRRPLDGKTMEQFNNQQVSQGDMHMDIQSTQSSFMNNRQPQSNNIKGATTDWSLTKYEITSGFPPRNTNAHVISKIADPSGLQFNSNSRFMESVPVMQRSHTFDYGERRSTHQPPSWQSKVPLVSAGSRMPTEDESRQNSATVSLRHFKNSPKMGRRNFQSNWNESYIETSSLHSIKSEEPVRKPGTPIFKQHANYMYKMEKPAESKSNYNVFQNENSLFDTTKNSNSFNSQFTSLTNKTTDPKEFDYDDNLYTIAERSRENSRPTSETGSDTNSLENLTSASNLNGVASISNFSIDLTCDHQFPGKDQTPKKSILKKGQGLASAQYDLAKMFAAGALEAPKQSPHMILSDEQMSLTSTNDKRRVTFKI